MFGKQTYYEKSAKIPFLLTGSGVPANKQIQALTSIMDIGPTICELAGTEYTFGEGRSLLPYFAGEEDGERIVVSQFVEKYKGESYASMMLRYKNYKYISYHHYENKDMLFNLKEDPKEGHNCITEKPEVVEYLKNERRKLISFDECSRRWRSPRWVCWRSGWAASWSCRAPWRRALAWGRPCASSSWR